jgi:uncharacterized HAD superfamily protein
MYESEVAHMMVQFLKAVFENTYSTMTMFQDQTERILMLTFEEFNSFSSQDKEVLKNWISSCKNAQEEYRNFMEGYLASIENSLPENMKTGQSH